MSLREMECREEGAPPPVDLAAERRHGDFVRALIADGRISACHDVADGGLLVAIAEMVMAGGCGVMLDTAAAGTMPLHGWLFGEDQGRYLIAAAREEIARLQQEALAARVPLTVIGSTGGDRLTLSPLGAISVSELRDAHEGWLPSFMAVPA